MGYTRGIDVSHYQGNINWGAVRASGIEIAIVKISGSDAGDYYDSKASTNYYGAKNAGLAIGGYHFAGGGDPVHEAEFFVNGMKPFEENDVFVLDWEVAHANPVAWCGTFLQRVHDLTGVWCILYMNGSTFNNYSWNANPAVANCGKWIAWYGRDPNQDLPVNGEYIAHQYSSSGSVSGIAGNVDMDAIYMDVATWHKYGYHAAQPAPAPTPAPTPTPPAPVVTTGEVSENKDIPFQKLTADDPTLDKGQTKVSQAGVNGVETVVYTVTYTDGQETNRVVKSDTVTTKPVDEITSVGTKEPTPTPTPDPTPTPTPTPVPNTKAHAILAVLGAIAAVIAAIIAFLHS